jgi:hypothetical protein
MEIDCYNLTTVCCVALLTWLVNYCILFKTYDGVSSSCLHLRPRTADLLSYFGLHRSNMQRNGSILVGNKYLLITFFAVLNSRHSFFMRD